jgi:hypothetical protein
MRRIRVAVALGVVLLVSGCGGASKPVVLPKLPLPLRDFIHSWIKDFPRSTIASIDVYGPGARGALVSASMGNHPPDKSTRSYLVVIHENSVCAGCVRPHPWLPAYYRIDIAVWSWSKGPTDWAITKTVPPAVKKLHRLAKVHVT